MTWFLSGEFFACLWGFWTAKLGIDYCSLLTCSWSSGEVHGEFRVQTCNSMYKLFIFTSIIWNWPNMNKTSKSPFFLLILWLTLFVETNKIVSFKVYFTNKWKFKHPFVQGPHILLCLTWSVEVVDLGLYYNSISVKLCMSEMFYFLSWKLWGSFMHDQWPSLRKCRRC